MLVSIKGPIQSSTVSTTGPGAAKPAPVPILSEYLKGMITYRQARQSGSKNESMSNCVCVFDIDISLCVFCLYKCVFYCIFKINLMGTLMLLIPKKMFCFYHNRSLIDSSAPSRKQIFLSV